MIANFEFMATTPDGKVWNVKEIKFFGDRIELTLYHNVDLGICTFVDHATKKIYYGSKKDEVNLYKKENLEWTMVNKNDN